MDINNIFASFFFDYFYFSNFCQTFIQVKSATKYIRKLKRKPSVGPSIRDEHEGHTDLWSLASFIPFLKSETMNADNRGGRESELSEPGQALC